MVEVCSVSMREMRVLEPSIGLRAFPTRAVVLLAIRAVAACLTCSRHRLRPRLQSAFVQSKWLFCPRKDAENLVDEAE